MQSQSPAEPAASRRSLNRRRSEAQTLLNSPATRGPPNSLGSPPSVRARVRRRVDLCDTEQAHANATTDERAATLRTLQTEMSSLEEATGTRPARTQDIAHNNTTRCT
jgi:hypothetical protein